MNLGAQNVALKDGFKIARAAIQYAFENSSKYFIRTLMGILISGFQDLAAAQPSVLQDLRAFLFYSISMLVLDLA